MDTPDVQEDYFVHCCLEIKGRVTSRVPCKVYLPRLPTERPRLEFSPDQAQARALSADLRGALLASVAGRTRLASPCVYFGPVKERFWGPGVSYCTATGEPHDLHVVEGEGVVEPGIVPLSLFFSPNPMLMPPGHLSVSFDGSSSFTPVAQSGYDLGGGLHLDFRTNFVGLPAPKNELRRAWHLAADCSAVVDVSDPATVKSRVLDPVDRFIAISSLGARVRTACLGWSGSPQGTWARFYRGGISIPEAREESAHDGLVAYADFREFAQSAYTALRGHPHEEEVLAAAYALTAPVRSLEAEFLMLFSAFERLVLAYRKHNGMEFALAQERWRPFLKQMRESIKTSGMLDARERGLIYQKLPELNRVSLKTATEAFIAHFAVQCEDLWPVFGKTGLATIRNGVIHGSFPTGLLRPLMAATEHLKWLLERCVLRLLGWEIGRSQARGAYLRGAGFLSYTRRSEAENAVAGWSSDEQ